MNNYVPRLQSEYAQKKKDLQKTLDLPNPMRTPKMTKIVLNIGQGDAAQNSKLLEGAISDLALISGQKPIKTRAKKSIAGFKLREGMPIGCSVTLRSKKMYEFLDRFINVSVPRVRDFRGFSPKSFDGRGNYSVGLREQIVFAEIDYDRVDRVRGLSVTFCTNASNDVEAKALLDLFNFPFRKN